MKLALILAIAIPLSAQTRTEITLDSAAVGVTLADVARTQACQSAGTCYEANPLLPQNGVARAAIELGVTAAATWWAHHERGKRKSWWVGQAAVIGAHSAAIALSRKR